MSSGFKIDWEEQNGWHRGYIYDHAALWPGVPGSPLAASLYRCITGEWYGTVWGKCSSSNACDIPPCDTLEEAKAVVVMLLRLDS